MTTGALATRNLPGSTGGQLETLLLDPSLLPAIVPDGGPVDLEIEKKVKQLDCLSLPFDSPSAAPRRPCQSHVPPRAAAAPVAKLRDTGRGDTNG
jgi:hypothetical protein